MKELYIFNVKEEFYKLYKNKQGELFYIFNRIYHMKELEKEYGYNLFCQINNFMDKEKINNLIQSHYKDKIMYSSSKNEHIINNLFLNEISILTVKNSNIRIETNTDKSSFIQDLKDLKMHLFVCDFKHQEYYFIAKKRTKANNL